MSRRTTFTTISPLPAGISREVVLDFLHNHLEMIDLNPLIKERHLIKPPSHAPPEEHSCAWYSLTDEISYLPGGLVTGDISYTCCFHDLPTGLQTHCYAPMGLDIRDKWTVAGSLPGEPVEPVELGLGAPLTGLYIREDIDMRCNVFTTSFVKKTLKKSHGLLVGRLKSKAQQASVAAVSHPSLSQTTVGSLQQQQLSTHQRHSSQSSLSGSIRSSSSLNSASHMPPQQTRQDPGQTSSLGNEINLPYRPSYTKPSPAPASDAHLSAYPEPLRIRHASKSSWPDIKSQPSALNNYTHASYSEVGSNTYDVKPTPSASPSPYAGGLPGGNARQRAERQQASGGALNGPFVAELE
ncbi:hypothetical protein EsH8_VIII_000572 [Colletotrichum jinshuiense]